MKKLVISVLSSKGGVGKTFISAITASSLNTLGYKIKFYDNDSESPLFSTYQSLRAEHIQLFKVDDEGHIYAESLNIDAQHTIANELEHGDNNIIVVDNGSPSFQPFLSYFQVNVLDAFNSIDVEFIVVIPISKDKITHNAPLEVLASYGKKVKYILVENEHFGEFDYDTSIFDIKQVQYAVIKMQRYTPSQLADINKAQELNLLLSEAIISREFNIVSKSRLTIAQELFQNLFLKILNDFGVRHAR